MINLNNEEFASKEFIPFNNGDAGIALNIKFNVERKTSEDKENAPDYKIIFEDDNGGTVNKAFWYLTEDDLKNKPSALKMQGQAMVHLWHVVKGKDTDIPQFKSPADMLDQTMAMLREATRFKANVAVDYGTEKYHKSLLEVKFFPPFMEVDVDDTKLYLGKSSMTTRNEPTQAATLFDDNGNIDESVAW